MRVCVCARARGVVCVRVRAWRRCVQLIRRSTLYDILSMRQRKHTERLPSMLESMLCVRTCMLACARVRACVHVRVVIQDCSRAQIRAVELSAWAPRGSDPPRSSRPLALFTPSSTIKWTIIQPLFVTKWMHIVSWRVTAVSER